jgi:nucleotide-binding universal stress UspA family protein
MWPASWPGAVASAPVPARARRDVPPPFGRILCGLDGSRSDHLAVEQAIALAGPGTALVFACVRETTGAGASRQARITAERADAALAAAVKAAKEAGVDAACEILPGRDPRPVLLEESSRSDLLVLASHGGSRAGGIALGSTASAAVHRAKVPVLVARQPPDGVAFPERILVATDGSPASDRAVELSVRIGHRHRAGVLLLSVDPQPHGNPHQIAAEAVELTTALGVEPTVIRAVGHAGDRILEAAAAESVALVALGSRGLTGVRALGSVSERVAHRAPCSVLVARPA